MALIDKKARFDTEKVLTVTAISANVKTTVTDVAASPQDFIDLNSVGSVPTYGLIHCKFLAAGGTSVNFQFVSATDVALTSGLKVHWESGVYAAAAIVAGLKFPFFLPPNGGAAGEYQTYIGFKYVAVGTFTGTGIGITSYIGPEADAVHTSKIFEHGLSLYP